jgi:hypothetical protein
MPCIRYTVVDWKYRVDERLEIQTGIKGFHAVIDGAELFEDGLLVLEVGFCWDGPSGPAVDTPSFMRGSAAHDLFYRLMRLRLLPQSVRKAADKLMYSLCREDGMWPIRAWYCTRAVRDFAAGAADPANVEQVLCAPGNCGRCKPSYVAEQMAP